MSMVIGKEARAELEVVVTSSPSPWTRKAVQSVLDRCTDAPEVGLPDVDWRVVAEPVAYQYEFTDPVSGNSIWMNSPGPWNLQNPKSSRPLYARPPDAGLPDELNTASNHRRRLKELLALMVDAAVLPGHQLTDADWQNACLLSGRYCEPFLSWTAGQKESGE